MKIEKTVIHNFMGIGEAEVPLNKRGLTQIKGKNNDSPSSDSNGAGKSSIEEAIYWCFTGQTKRGLRGDEVVNEHMPKDADGCFVGTFFKADGIDYTLGRYRKSKIHGNKIYLKSGKEDLTKGTNPETQKLLNDIIKFSPLTLSKMISFGQQDIKPFASLRDSELKKVFEESLGIDFIKSHYAVAKGHHDTIKREISRFETEKDQVKEKIDSVESTLPTVQDAHDNWEKSQDIRIKDFEADLKGAIEKRDHLVSKIAALSEDLKGLVESVINPEHVQLMDQLNAKIDSIKEDRSKIKGTFELLATNIKETESLIKRANAKVGLPCSECGKTYEEEDIKTYIDNLVAKVKTDCDKATAKREATKKLDAKVAELQILRDNLAAEIDNQGAAIAECQIEKDRINAKIEELTALKDEYNDVIDAQTKRVADAKESRVNPFAGNLGKLKTKKIELNTELKVIDKNIAKKQDEEIIAGYLVEALGNGGLKNHVFAGVTPELNRIANEYLSQLDDIEVEISTVKKLKTGELRDKFEIKVMNRHGAKLYKGNSGGEKQKIDLAIAMAFNKVVSGMSPESLNVLFLDEPFESLDPGSSECVVDLCETFIEDNDVYIITHNQSVKDLVVNTITVEKTGGRAKITS